MIFHKLSPSFPRDLVPVFYREGSYEELKELRKELGLLGCYKRVKGQDDATIQM